MAEVPEPAPGCFRFGSSNWMCARVNCARQACASACRNSHSRCWRLLLERPGDLVTRDELRQRLWPNGTFVDFEHGLNAVINRLRETLGDSADSPRFIQTVPRRGYRFIAPVDGARVDARTEDPASLSVLETALPGKRTTALLPWIAGATTIAVSLLLVIAATWLLRRTPPRHGAAAASGAAHEARRHRGVAGICARWRTGRVRVVRREL